MSYGTYKFKPGDIVQAVVDGRLMTVHRYDVYGNVVCHWFVGTQIERATFAESRLMRVSS